MAQLQVHVEKADMFWRLAQTKFEAKATPFICMNLVMYTIGHLIEALLARQNRHPGSPPRGVMHASREAMLRKNLVSTKIVEEKWANSYTELHDSRDTFLDGGITGREFLDEYMRQAKPLVAYLYECVAAGDRAQKAISN